MEIETTPGKIEKAASFQLDFGSKIGSKPDVEKINRLGGDCLNLTDRFYRKLESEIFPAIQVALEHLNTKRSKVGMAQHFRSNIKPEHIKHLVQLAKDQVMLPVQDSPWGVDMKDLGAQIFLRQFLYIFHDTRLWAEEIAPHFNHALLEAILRSPEFAEKCSFGIFPKHRFRWGGMQSPKSDTASILRSLINRTDKLFITDRSFSLHTWVTDQCEQEFPGQNPQKHTEEYTRRYNELWLANENYLFSPELLDYMQDRRAIFIEVNVPSPYSATQLTEVMLSKKTVDYILEHDNNEKFSDDPILNDAMGAILSEILSLVVVGGRDFTREFVENQLKMWIKERTNEYIFAAIVKKEYLAPAQPKKR